MPAGASTDGKIKQQSAAEAPWRFLRD
jgi:hypothetical protein